MSRPYAHAYADQPGAHFASKDERRTHAGGQHTPASAYAKHGMPPGCVVSDPGAPQRYSTPASKQSHTPVPGLVQSSDTRPTDTGLRASHAIGVTPASASAAAASATGALVAS